MPGSLSPWRKPGCEHDPGKILLDVAMAPAVGGDCLADAGVLRAQPGLYGDVASDLTISRLFTLLGGQADGVEAGVRRTTAPTYKKT